MAPNSSPSRAEQLADELSLQQVILASLLDMPPTATTAGHIAAVKAEIADIKTKLNEARANVRPNPAPSANAEPTERLTSRPAVGTSTSASSSSSNSMNSSPGNGRSAGSGTPSRKRSIGSSNLGVGTWSWGNTKSRRTTPSPGPRGFRPTSSGFGDDGFQDASVIDLTGDDDNEWRNTIQRQKEVEERLRRRKAEADRDAALARQLAGQPSPPRTESNNLGAPSQSSQHNVFDRISGRSSTPSAWAPRPAAQVKHELSPTLASRPRHLAGSGPGFTGSQDAGRSPSAPFPGPSRAGDYRYGMPGAYVDSDGEDATSTPSAAAPPQTFNSSASPRRIVHEFGRPTSLGPTAQSSTPYSIIPPPGYSVRVNHSPGSNVPAVEFARLSSMARQGAPPPWPPVGPVGNMPGMNRPGVLYNGSYYPQPGPTMVPSTLSSIIDRTNRYDFNAMLDGDGNPLSSTVIDLIDDYVNDPRKTEEDIQQLLSNIRPDMEIPVEERGETPEAMRYPLYPHQQLALKWMCGMEEGTNKGAILADDMGLGKTISTLALIVSRPSEDRSVKTNLIIGPLALIKQWEQEVKKKLKTTHKLSVLLLHQKKKPYSEIKRYDVVLTTYGSLAAEWKRYHQHVAQRKDSPGYREEADAELAKKCALLHPQSKFYRIILDEAQCIKNRKTQGSMGVHQLLGTYRWCLTGTPMMNNVSELYPLIRFLRIRPYCDFKMFQKDFGSLAPRSARSDYHRDTAMRKLQAVLKAIMLRRMKSSTIDGKPILTLPEKIENDEHVTFSDDEQKFYTDLESRSQVMFNKYLRAGTVGKNYSNILVLLLRLRQACCHPHLMDFECVAAANPEVDMANLAKELDAAVVERVKAIEAFECCICYDGVEDPMLIIPCGHDTCSECLSSLTETAAQNSLRSGDENAAAAKCPVCRGPVDFKRVINLTAFRKVHAPEALSPEDAAAVKGAEAAETDEYSTDDDSSSWDDDDDDEGDDVDAAGNLAGFVVADNEIEDGDNTENGDGDVDDDDLDAELAAVARDKRETGATSTEDAQKDKKREKKSKKGKKSRRADGKGKKKSKSEEVQPHMVKKLRIEAGKNKDARRRYLHYLRDNWEDSAKVSEVVSLLEQIQQSGEKTIIFSQWTALLDLVECQVRYKLQLRYCRYTGGMSRNQRDEAVSDFTENPRTRVMLVSLRAGNAGLNLTAASRIIILDPFWNPYIEMQAVDRAHRIGQQREVRVHRLLVKGTVEDRIVELQENKRKLVDAALDEGGSKSVGRLSERELAYLFGVNPALPAAAAEGSAAAGGRRNRR